MDGTLVYWAMKHAVSLCLGWVPCRLVGIRRPVLYWALFTVVVFLPDLGIVSQNVAAALAVVFLFIVFPAAFCRVRGAAMRGLAAFMCLSIAVLGEVVGSAAYVLLFGGAINDAAAIAANPWAVVSVQVLDMACVLGLARLLAPVTRGIAASQMPGAARLAAWVMPAGFVSMAMLLTMGVSCFPADTALLAPIVLLAVACLAVNVLALRAIVLARQEAQERERAAALERQIDACLASYAKLEAQATRAARLRHDARNHIGVLRGLVDAGKKDAALAYARALADEYGDGADVGAAGGGGR